MFPHLLIYFTKFLDVAKFIFSLDFGLIIFTIAEAHILPETNPTLATHLRKVTT